ncbi:MAG: hypothetical protein EOO07_23845 [Chitinophagaceae bacterium]|nr:MAG: hypothetical protein EOO07_23845 [Chitinophagaceae bacterium]
MSECEIEVERDSVCMGDDANAPHTYRFKISTQAMLNNVFDHLASEHYLASVGGKNHTWEATIGSPQGIQSQKIVLIKGNNQYPEPSSILSDEISSYASNGKLSIYFNYISAPD